MDYILWNLKHYVENAAIDFTLYKAISVVVAFIMLLFLISSGQHFGVRICQALLAGYLYILFSLTVLIRPDYGTYQIDLTPFWTYRAIRAGREYLVYEIIENLVMLMPVGLLLCLQFGGGNHEIRDGKNRKKTAWMHFGVSAVYMMMFSVAIETCQYFTKAGLAEFDDVMHNTLGGMAGYGIGAGCRNLYRLLKIHMGYGKGGGSDKKDKEKVE